MFFANMTKSYSRWNLFLSWLRLTGLDLLNHLRSGTVAVLLIHHKTGIDRFSQKVKTLHIFGCDTWHGVTRRLVRTRELKSSAGKTPQQMPSVRQQERPRATEMMEETKGTLSLQNHAATAHPLATLLASARRLACMFAETFAASATHRRGFHRRHRAAAA